MNDLDLFVTQRGETQRFFPNGLNRRDSTNNVERVRIENPKDAYTIHVVGTNLVENQVYSLVVTGCFGDGAAPSNPVAPSPTPALVEVVPMEPASEIVATDCQDGSNKFVVRYDADRGTWVILVGCS